MKTKAILVMLICIIKLYSQSYDNTWVLGYGHIDDPRPYGHTNITFYDNKADTQFLNRKVSLVRNTASISDPITGDLILYSNGCGIFDPNDNILLGSENLNPGRLHDEWCEVGYPGFQNHCFLPDPYDSHKIYFFHQAYDYNDTIVGRQYVTIVEKQNEKWTVSAANKLLIRTPIFDSSFKLVKKSNGRDWWMMFFNHASDSLFRFSIDRDGIKGPFIQHFPVQRGRRDWRASTAMSPNGEILVRCDLLSGISVMNFNRESGLLSNLRFLPMWITDIDSINWLQVTGCSISPNNRYLYFSTPMDLWQFDLSQVNLLDGMILIDSFDGFNLPYGTRFYGHQLAPDGKIYINCTNGVEYMHFIEKPDLEGKECRFLQHQFTLPGYNAFALPYFPNYKLGPLNTYDISSKEMHILIYPNPASSYIIIHHKMDIDLDVSIYNLIGEKVMLISSLSGHSNHLIDIGKIPNAMYNVVLSDHGKVIKTEKILVQHN